MIDWILRPTKTSNREWAADIGPLLFWATMEWHSRQRVSVNLWVVHESRATHLEHEICERGPLADAQLARLMNEDLVMQYAVETVL